jgi:glycosyltransferase involved in cell wall biosynthesis
LKLVYDLRILGERMHGMARYALELLRSLLEIESELTVAALVRRPGDSGLLPQDPRVVAVAYDLNPYGLLSQLRMPFLLEGLKPDLYHCPFYAPPARFSGPMVFTVHDLIHLRFPKNYGLKHRLFYKYVVLPAAKRARAVFTVSKHSQQDLIGLLGVDAGKIVITPNGVDPRYTPLDPEQKHRALDKLGWPAEYILGVGNPRPHKNLMALVQAHRQLKNNPPPGLERIPPLVLVGVSPGQLPQTDPGPDLLMVENLGDQGLRLAYGAAQVVVIPSLYEGFGLPALEALACGAPLIASNRASLPEVVGKAGVLCSPDPEDIAQALRRLLGDADLRKDLAEAGPLQAGNFTWEKTAQKTLRVYRQIVNGVL